MNYLKALQQAKGVLYKPELGQAIFDGRKTVTRRVAKTSTEKGMKGPVIRGKKGEVSVIGFAAIAGLCPYGVPGDYLYVKETYYAWGFWKDEYSVRKKRFSWRFVDDTRETGRHYRFTQPEQPPGQLGSRLDFGPAWHKRPSLFMPRHATRSLLRIVGVRVERLQDISKADAIAEGGPPSHFSIDSVSREFGYPDFPRSWFAQLWESINGTGSWEANPWVWVIEFERVAP